MKRSRKYHGVEAKSGVKKMLKLRCQSVGWLIHVNGPATNNDGISWVERKKVRILFAWLFVLKIKVESFPLCKNSYSSHFLNCAVQQRSPTLLAQGTVSVEDNFSTDGVVGVEGMVSG